MTQAKVRKKPGIDALGRWSGDQPLCQASQHHTDLAAILASMDEKPGKQNRAVVVTAVATVVLVLVLYVLSIGPAWALVNRRILSVDTYHSVYRPLLGLSKTSVATDKLLSRYCLTWERWARAEP